MDFRPSRKFSLIAASILVLILISLACNAPMGKTTVITVVVANPAGNNPANAPAQNTNPAPAAAQPTAPSATVTPPPITATVAHQTKPGSYPGSGLVVWDSDSSVTASQHRPQGGEYFDRNLFERPFNGGSQDIYFPQADILKSSFLAGSPWNYASITLKGVGSTSNSLDGTYAIELDLDKNGRGDYLILANKPQAADWSSDGVQVWHDSNKDVGNSTPIRSDPPQSGNGYDELVYDQGKAADPDLAWARVSPNNHNEVWIAFKPAILGGSSAFLWSAWAQMEGMHPEWLDYNDHFTHDEAGSPLPGISQYPLKALAEVDNTCRWAVGFSPTGNEPGLCPLPATATPVPPTPVPPTPVPTIRMFFYAVPFHTKTPTEYPLH